MVFDIFRSRRVLLGSALLTAGLLTGPLMPSHAFALYSTCRTDPKVELSDGSVVTLTATMADDVTDVNQVTYVLHAPAGTSVTNVVFTGNEFRGRETLEFAPDQAAGTYNADTTVSTNASNVAVTATAAVSNDSGVSSGSTDGYSNETLQVKPNGTPASQHRNNGSQGSGSSANGGPNSNGHRSRP